MLEVMGILVVKRKAAVGVVALFGGAGLNPEERIDKASPGGPLIAGEEDSSIDGAARARAGSEIDNGRACARGD